jgi:hypothetical protein
MKSEIRRPKSEGNPKAEIRNPESGPSFGTVVARQASASGLSIERGTDARRLSDFGFRISFGPSDFGFRISAFGLPSGLRISDLRRI